MSPADSIVIPKTEQADFPRPALRLRGNRVVQRGLRNLGAGTAETSLRGKWL